MKIRRMQNLSNNSASLVRDVTLDELNVRHTNQRPDKEENKFLNKQGMKQANCCFLL